MLCHMSLSFGFFHFFFLFFCHIIVKSCELRALYHAHPFNFILKIWNFRKYCLYLQRECLIVFVWQEKNLLDKTKELTRWIEEHLASNKS